MARLPDEFISQLKSANDIVDMFRTYADVKKRGRIYVCCCPFHSEKTPSCTIYPDDDPHFYCFGCHEGGDVIRFVMLTDNVSYMEAVRILAQRCGMSLPVMNPEEKSSASLRDKCYEINRETANFYYQNLLKGSDKTGLQYLKYYQIRPETVRKYAIGYASGDWQNLHYHLRQKGYSDEEISASKVCRKNQNEKLYDTFRNRIIFPSVDFRGNVTGFGGRSADNENPLFLYTGIQSENTIFSLNFAKKENITKSLILAEDYFTASAIYQAGHA
ncbi:MAG: DNA primase, partial [Oscillospiraceae bacterium]|nr:DNA primase [Oscillospiraceae bacterium]